MSRIDENLVTDALVDRGMELFAQPRLYEADQPAALRAFVGNVLDEMAEILVPELEQILEQGDKFIVSHRGEVVVVSVRLEDEEAEELLDRAGNGSVEFVKRAIASALAEHDEYSRRGSQVSLTVNVQPEEALDNKLDRVLQSVQSERSRNDKRWRALMANLEGLENAVAALATDEAAAAAEMQALTAEIATLQAGSVTQEQIDAVTAKAQGVAEALSSATAAAEAATTPPAVEEPAPPAEGDTPPAEPPAPVEPAEPTEPTAPVEPPAPAEGDTPAPAEGGEAPAPDAPAEGETPDPAPAPDAPAPDAPAEGGSPADPAAPGDWTPDDEG